MFFYLHINLVEKFILELTQTSYLGSHHSFIERVTHLLRRVRISTMPKNETLPHSVPLPALATRRTLWLNR